MPRWQHISYSLVLTEGTPRGRVSRNKYLPEGGILGFRELYEYIVYTHHFYVQIASLLFCWTSYIISFGWFLWCVKEAKNWYTYVIIVSLSLKSVAIYKQLGYLNFMSFCVFFVPRQKAVFGQDICNTHEYMCSHTTIRIFFLKIIFFYFRTLIWKASIIHIYREFEISLDIWRL